MGKRKFILPGTRFGAWTVLEAAPRETVKGPSLYRIQCECGLIKVKAGLELTAGRSQSCGCGANRVDRSGEANTGGMTHSEIGKILGISRQRVAQIEARAMRKLREV